MKRKIFFLSSIVIGLAFGSSGLKAQTDREGSKSVVKITTSFIANENGKTVKKIGNASGWCWKDPMHIVTDLHVVAGIADQDIKVYTDQEARSSGAKVIKVLKEADLALLELNSDLGIIPLEIQEVDPNSTREYTIWGFPHGIFAMAGDDIRFSRSQSSNPTLNSIVNGNELKFTLESQKYPSPNARILRISSTIQPGHSGAPIFSPNGKVIGIADGGLREGTARLNWAMPAVEYVPRLLNSNELKPDKRSIQASLYSNITTVDVQTTEAQEVAELKEDAKENTVSNGNNSISKTWTASYREITETMDEADLADLKSISESLKINMDNTEYDVYEDFDTGATITIPAGENFSVQNGWYISQNQDQSIIYSALPFDSKTYSDAKSNVYDVLEKNFPESKWELDTESPDTTNIDDEIETADYSMTRIATDGSGKQLDFTATVDGQYLLVTFLIYNPARMEDRDYLKKLLHYSIAMEMAAFAEE